MIPSLTLCNVVETLEDILGKLQEKTVFNSVMQSKWLTHTHIHIHHTIPLIHGGDLIRLSAWWLYLQLSAWLTDKREHHMTMMSPLHHLHSSQCWWMQPYSVPGVHQGTAQLPCPPAEWGAFGRLGGQGAKTK